MLFDSGNIIVKTISPNYEPQWSWDYESNDDTKILISFGLGK